MKNSTKRLRNLEKLLLVALVCCCTTGFAQWNTWCYKDFTTDGTYIVPENCTEIYIEAIGAGGAGGYANDPGVLQATHARVGTGGGGGGYARIHIGGSPVGNTYNITIGQGGKCNNKVFTDGTPTIVKFNNSVLIQANAGGNGTSNLDFKNVNTSGAGGTATGGDVNYTGGRGGYNCDNRDGEGGLLHDKVGSGAGGGAAGGNGDGGYWDQPRTYQSGSIGPLPIYEQPEAGNGYGLGGGGSATGIEGIANWLKGGNGAAARNGSSGWGQTNSATEYGGGGAGARTKHDNAFSNAGDRDGGSGANGIVRVWFHIVKNDVQLAISPASADNVCTGASVTLTANSSNLMGTASYAWNTGATSNAITVNPTSSTTYKVTLTDTYASNCIATLSKEVNVTVAPAITPGAISTTGQTVCQGGTATEIADATTPSTCSGTVNYKWQVTTDDGTTWADAGGTNTNLTYTPTAYTSTPGVYKFRRCISDGNSTEVSEGVYSLTVVEALVANNDSYARNAGTNALELDVLANDIASSITEVSIETNPTHGTAVWDASLQKIVYTTDGDADDSFEYTISNSTCSATAEVTIKISSLELDCAQKGEGSCFSFSEATFSGLARTIQVNYTEIPENCNITLPTLPAGWESDTAKYNGNNVAYLVSLPSTVTENEIQDFIRGITFCIPADSIKQVTVTVNGLNNESKWSSLGYTVDYSDLEIGMLTPAELLLAVQANGEVGALNPGLLAGTESIMVGVTPSKISAIIEAYGPQNTLSYKWFCNGTEIPGATEATFNPISYADSLGTFIFTRHVKDSCSSAFIATKGADTLIVNAAFALNEIDGNTSFCQGENTVLTASTGDVVDDIKYLWNTGDTTASITVSASGKYSVVATATFGLNTATDTKEVEVTVNALPNVVITSTDESCKGSDGTAKAVVTPSSTTYTYLWSNGCTTDSCGTLTSQVNEGKYYVTVTDTNGCTASDTTYIKLYNPLELNDIILPAICSGNEFSYTPANGTDGVILADTKYSWPAPAAIEGVSGMAADTNATRIHGLITNTTNHPVEIDYDVTPHNGICVGNTSRLSITVKATVNPEVGVEVNINDTTLCPNSGDVKLDISFSGVNSIHSVVWKLDTTVVRSQENVPASISTDSYTLPSTVLSASCDTFYTLRVEYTDTSNCTASDDANIKVMVADWKIDPTLYPNGTKVVECLSTAVEPSSDVIPTESEIIDGCNQSTSRELLSVDTVPVTITCEGTITYTYRYTACDNSYKDWTYTYIVKDTTAPVIASTLTDSLSANVDNSKCEFSVPDMTTSVKANASDNCTENDELTISQSPVAGTAITEATKVVVIVEDKCGNKSTDTIKVTVPTPLSVSIASQEDILCKDLSTGSINLTVDGGTADYSYN